MKIKTNHMAMYQDLRLRTVTASMSSLLTPFCCLIRFFKIIVLIILTSHNEVDCLVFLLRLSLEGLKRKIIRNLRMLESQGVVTIKNDYQDIINAIAKVRHRVCLHLNTSTIAD